MTAPIGSWVTVTLVASDSTPAEQQALVGRTLAIPPEYQSRLGSGPDDPGVLAGGIRGYLRTAADNTPEWVIVGPVSAEMRQALQTIPGPGGWSRPGSRTAYATVGRTLLETYEVPSADVVTTLRSLYEAARLDYAARIAAGG